MNLVVYTIAKQKYRYGVQRFGYGLIFNGFEKRNIMTRLDLIEQFEDETELPATWNNGGMGGYTKEYTEWLEQCLVKNLTIPVVSNCPSEQENDRKPDVDELQFSDSFI